MSPASPTRRGVIVAEYSYDAWGNGSVVQQPLPPPPTTIPTTTTVPPTTTAPEDAPFEEVPNLEGLRALCDGWGFDQQETEDMLLLIVSVAAEEPLIAAMIAADDLIGGGNAGLYANGPVQSAGCSGSAETENAIILACANFYPIAVAIREEAAVVLDLDLNDENEAFLANLFAILFLTCYFADYPEHVNIWLVGKGENPIDFGGSMSQTSGMAQQMNDLFGENAGSFQKQINLGKLNKFALDTTHVKGYTNSSGGGNSSQQSSSSSSSGPDIGEINPIRYRGYYYDVETEYYFLQTRYYSPEWRRFINADCLFIAGDYLTGTNMYAYCNGNPVMYIDPNGMDPWIDFMIGFLALGSILEFMGLSEGQIKTVFENMLNYFSDGGFGLGDVVDGIYATFTDLLKRLQIEAVSDDKNVSAKFTLTGIRITLNDAGAKMFYDSLDYATGAVGTVVGALTGKLWAGILVGALWRNKRNDVRDKNNGNGVYVDLDYGTILSFGYLALPQLIRVSTR